MRSRVWDARDRTRSSTQPLVISRTALREEAQHVRETVRVCVHPRSVRPRDDDVMIRADPGRSCEGIRRQPSLSAAVLQMETTTLVVAYMSRH